MQTWEWLTVALVIIAIIVGMRVLLLELRFNRTKNLRTHCEKWMVKYSSRAQQDIKISSNFLCPCVFNKAAETIIKKLNENPGMKIIMVTGPQIFKEEGANNKLYETYKSGRYGNRLRLCSLKGDIPQEFILVDNKHAYISEPGDFMPAPQGSAIIVTNCNSAVKLLSQRFDRLTQSPDISHDVESVNDVNLEQYLSEQNLKTCKATS